MFKTTFILKKYCSLKKTKTYKNNQKTIIVIKTYKDKQKIIKIIIFCKNNQIKKMKKYKNK